MFASQVGDLVGHRQRGDQDPNVSMTEMTTQEALKSLTGEQTQSEGEQSLDMLQGVEVVALYLR